MNVAIIPCRAGSKRVKDKNRRVVGYLELWQHSLKHAIEAECIDYIIVTTNDEAIINRGKLFAETQGLKNIEFQKRPEELSKDDTKMIDVIQHAIREFKDKIEYITLLQPTSIFRGNSIKIIDECYKRLLENKHYSSLITVHETYHPCKMYYEGGTQVHEKTDYDGNIDKAYLRNGNVFITEKNIIEQGLIYERYPLMVKIEPWQGIDIDTEDDLMMARLIYEYKKHEGTIK